VRRGLGRPAADQRGGHALVGEEVEEAALVGMRCLRVGEVERGIPAKLICTSFILGVVLYAGVRVRQARCWVIDSTWSSLSRIPQCNVRSGDDTATCFD